MIMRKLWYILSLVTKIPYAGDTSGGDYTAHQPPLRHIMRVGSECVSNINNCSNLAYIRVVRITLPRRAFRCRTRVLSIRCTLDSIARFVYGDSVQVIPPPPLSWYDVRNGTPVATKSLEYYENEFSSVSECSEWDSPFWRSPSGPFLAYFMLLFNNMCYLRNRRVVLL